MISKIVYDADKAEKEIMKHHTIGKKTGKQLKRFTSISNVTYAFLIILTIATPFIIVYQTNMNKWAEIAIAVLSFCILAVIVFEIHCWCNIKKEFLESKCQPLSDNARYHIFVSMIKPDEKEILKHINIDEIGNINIRGECPLYSNFQFNDGYKLIKTNEDTDSIDMLEHKIYLKKSKAQIEDEKIEKEKKEKKEKQIKWVNFNFKEATILSVKEYGKYHKRIPLCERPWWLKTEGVASYLEIYVGCDGEPNEDGALKRSFQGVRPTIQIEVDKPEYFKIKDKVKIFDLQWIIIDINENVFTLIAEECICPHNFDENRNTWEESGLKKFIDNKFEYLSSAFDNIIILN